jgi:hypothetical protein
MGTQPLSEFSHCFQQSFHWKSPSSVYFNPLKPNDLKRHHAVSPLIIKIVSKNMREKPINTPIHLVY